MLKTSEAQRAAMYRYSLTRKGKEARARAQAKYRTSGGGKERILAYQSSERGRAAQARALDKFRSEPSRAKRAKATRSENEKREIRRSRILIGLPAEWSGAEFEKAVYHTQEEKSAALALEDLI